MKYRILTSAIICINLAATAQAPLQYAVDATAPGKDIRSGNLRLGGSAPGGKTISVNNYYIAVDGRPFIPIMGEFHYSRYPYRYWDESLKKMKAGGINVVATYVFWNLHEEKEGLFTWEGDKDLRHFLELCRSNNLYAIVRIGPFCHGEIRNGGLPDWLMGKALTIRSNDPGYLFYVDRLYREIGDQLKGLYYKDGGPVIGIQLENEYQHSAAPWGLTYPGQPYDFTSAERDMRVTQEGVGTSREDNPYAGLGNEHMKILKSLAVKAGMDVPLYTATGWGNAAIIPDESLPVTAAYAYPFWTPGRDYSPFFLYKDMHSVPDYAPVRYKPDDYPVMAAELGSGIMSVYTRRPVVDHKSMDAMINRCLGSGANGIGYYMYHGGSTPMGHQSFMSDEAYGLPKISYDFQAPIGEYGQVREGFQRLKLIHYFLRDFGEILAPMFTVLPASAESLKPENITDLRYAVRINENSGFLFINNFQDDTVMLAKNNIQVKIKTTSGDILIPEKGGFSMQSGENAIFPFNFDLNGAKLIYATAQMLVKGFNDAIPYYVFFTPPGIQGEFSFEPGSKARNISGVTVSTNGKRTLVKCTDAVSEFSINTGRGKSTILVIDKELALKSYTAFIGGSKYLIFSDAVVVEESTGNFGLLNAVNPAFEISIYPKITTAPVIAEGSVSRISVKSPFSTFMIALPEQKYEVRSQMISQRKWTVGIPQGISASVDDIFLTIDYTGDTGMAFLNGELVADEFYKGIPWEIGLRRFIEPSPAANEIVLYFRAMPKNSGYLKDLQPYPKSIPDFGMSNSYLKINKISLVPRYRALIKFGNE